MNILQRHLDSTLALILSCSEPTSLVVQGVSFFRYNLCKLKASEWMNPYFVGAFKVLKFELLNVQWITLFESVMALAQSLKTAQSQFCC